MNKLILNRVAIWQAKSLDRFTMRTSSAGRVYFDNGVVKTSDKEMYRYAKNYTVGKGKTAIKFCLFIMTYSDASKQIEKFLDGVAKTLDIALIQKVLVNSSASNFDYTDNYYKEMK